MSIFGPTPPQIWGYRPREVPQQVTGWIVPTELTYHNLLTVRYGVELTGSDLHAATVIEPAPAPNAIETTMLDVIFLTPVHGAGRLKAWRSFLRDTHFFFAAIADTYNMRMYLTPGFRTFAGVWTALDAEQLIGTFTLVGVGPGAWANNNMLNAISRTLDAAFNGSLGIRVRCTSWALGGNNNSAGMHNLWQPGQQYFAFNFTMD